jgi:uncharacterized protein (DUF1778 family)
MATSEKARFDTRLDKEQKAFFEYAASLGGFRTLTEFVIYAAQKQAKEIVKEHEHFLATERDRKVFFDALMNAPEPNENLKNAAADFNRLLNS